MGNCLSGLAFKEEGLEEEPKYELTRPNPRATPSREYIEMKFTSNSKSTQVHKDDIFEPRSSNVENKEQDPDPVSKSVEISANPIKSEDATETTMEGIMNALTDLELELNKRTDWLNQPEVDDKDEEEEVPNQEQENPSNQATEMPSEVPEQEQNMPLQVLEIPEQPQVAKKTPKRELRKRQPKAKKRRISFVNPAESSDEAPNPVDSDWLSSSDVALKVPKHKIRTAKRPPSFNHVKPHNRFKHLVNKRNQQAANIKNQIRCASLKIKAE